MSAEIYEAIDEAATTLYQLLQDERIRQQCEAREKYIMECRDIENRLKKQTETIDQLTEEKKQQAETIEKMAKRIAELEANQK